MAESRETAEAFTPDEILFITAPDFISTWNVAVIEAILTTLRKHGRCYVSVPSFKERKKEVPTLAEILYL